MRPFQTIASILFGQLPLVGGVARPTLCPPKTFPLGEGFTADAVTDEVAPFRPPHAGRTIEVPALRGGVPF